MSRVYHKCDSYCTSSKSSLIPPDFKKLIKRTRYNEYLSKAETPLTAFFQMSHPSKKIKLSESFSPVDSENQDTRSTLAVNPMQVPTSLWVRWLDEIKEIDLGGIDYYYDLIQVIQNAWESNLRLLNWKVLELHVAETDQLIEPLSKMMDTLNLPGVLPNSEQKPTIYLKTPIDQKIRQDSSVIHRRLIRFRGPLASYVRLKARRLFQAPDPSKTKGENALLRRSSCLTLFGIVVWEFLERYAPVDPSIQILFDGLPRLQLPHINNQVVDAPLTDQNFPNLRALLDGLNSSGLISSHILAQKLLAQTHLSIPETMPNGHRIVDGIWSTLVKFRLCTKSSLDSQIVTILWLPIIQACLVDPSGGHLSVTTQYCTRTIEPNLVSDQRVDIAILFDSSSLPPPVLIEGSSHPLATDSNRSGFYHKDYHKLACTMSMVFRHYWGLFANETVHRQQLVIFGLLIAGTQIQYCVMYAIQPTDRDQPYSLMFQTSRDWLNDFSSPDNPCFYRDSNCVRGICKPFPDAVFLTPADPALDLTPLDSNLIQPENVKIEETDQEPSRLFNHDNNEEDESFRQISTDIDGLQRNIHSLIAFCDFARRTALDIHQKACNLQNPGSPESIDKDLLHPDYFPSSVSKISPSHLCQTPGAQVLPSLTGKPSFHFPLVKVTHVSRTDQKNNTTEYVIVKKCIRHENAKLEVKALRALQDCKHIVPLYAHLLTADTLYLYEEQLLNFREIGIRASNIAQLFPLSLQFLLDSLSAIESLRTHQIIHRDIKNSNILYSRTNQCFKLIDFDLAVFADAQGEYKQEREKPCGTEGYIAPELYAGRPYSWRSDLFALGASYFELSLMIEHHLEMQDQHEHLTLLEVIDELIRKKCFHRNPARRSLPLELKERVLDVYTQMSRVYHKYDSYWFTPYDRVIFIQQQRDELSEALKIQKCS